MQYAAGLDGPDLLGWWMRQPTRRDRLRTRRPATPKPPGTRFALGGRMSTREFQDRRSSARWQRDFAEDVIDGRGRQHDEFQAPAQRRRDPEPASGPTMVEFQNNAVSPGWA
ncbi:hypothetical protein AB0C02_22725 [Micromonospora sp. NPDC048999]|uniref:hypothetical protein n=1 Tax=Micromonospora sp. NPDC048999 TaxID=3155391 RepID=UPI0033CA18EC